MSPNVRFYKDPKELLQTAETRCLRAVAGYKMADRKYNGDIRSKGYQYSHRNCTQN
jgi:hypothetical protein